MQLFEQKNTHNASTELMTKQETLLSRAHRIVTSLYAGYKGVVAVQLWNGTIISNSNEVQCTLHINHPGVLRDLVLHQDLIKLAEAFITGQAEIMGDMEAVFKLESHLKSLSLDYPTKLRLFVDAFFLPSLNGKSYSNQLKAGYRQQKNSRQAISHHYDVGNDFYRLWLDKNMVYSCAYFRHKQQPLDEAQQDKLDYICQKLRLQSGQTLLDIGCGWGALAIWAAKHYGVTVQGITLSQEQYALAVRRVKKAGLENQVKIELLDYRDLSDTQQYDRVVSVGMFEHIGVKNFPQYFEKVKRVLKSEGLFLNHGITSKDGWRKTPLTRFMNQYIFPDGELARISDVNDAMENAGFEIIDVESLRRHYALTLRHWVKALEFWKETAIRHTSAETYRLWRLYMAGCAYYFDEGSINIHQILVGHQQNALSIPLRREDLYRKSY